MTEEEINKIIAPLFSKLVMLKTVAREGMELAHNLAEEMPNEHKWRCFRVVELLEETIVKVRDDMIGTIKP